MLIDFTVENYRSIKDPVTLSAIAQPSRATGRANGSVKTDEEIAPAFLVEGQGFSLLPILALFGANASGKSNMLKALDELIAFMAMGNWKRKSFPAHLARFFTPFRLDYAHFHLPTQLSFRVVIKEVIYSYALSVDNKRIIKEALSYTPADSRRSKTLFDRTWNNNTNIYDWDNKGDLSGAFTQLQPLIEEYTPYISLFTFQFHDPKLRNFTDWLNAYPFARSVGQSSSDFDYAVEMFSQEQPERQQHIIKLICLFDTGIADIQIKNLDNGHRIEAVHQVPRGNFTLSFEEESLGTQRLFALACQIVRVLGQGSLLVVDELGPHLHPNIVRRIVQMFQSPVTNPKRAQLIFTSHDNTLQRNGLLRRDQIWFTQKRPDGSTELYPLTDFKPRNDLALDKAYLDGRFGAVPILPSESEWEEIISPAAEAVS